MNEQITLSGFESPEYYEVQYLNSVLSRLQNAVAEHGAEGHKLTYSTTTGYSVVSFLKFTCFRLKIRGKQCFISVPLVFSDLIPSIFPQKRLQSEPKYVRILIDEKHTVDTYTDFLVQIAGETVNRYPKAWDCCSRYLECSNAKTCIHPDKTFALECGYRKILNSGRIFYGENRNIE